eukprot:SAG22_NODE_66_length_22936_cov_626.714279_19_plen_118_part_00
MSGSGYGKGGSCPGPSFNETVIDSVGLTLTRGASWDVRHFQNLFQSTCDRTLTTGASQHGSQHLFSSHLHLFDFRFRSVALSVSLYIAQTPERVQILSAPANLQATMRKLTVWSATT